VIRRRACRRVDDGVATVWAALLIAVLSLITLVAAGLVGVIAARHRAEAAADLAALAGAVAARDGNDPCAAASIIAAANEATMLSCSELDRVVEVSVGVSASGLAGLDWEQVGVARAGPAQPTGADPSLARQ